MWIASPEFFLIYHISDPTATTCVTRGVTNCVIVILDFRPPPFPIEHDV